MTRESGQLLTYPRLSFEELVELTEATELTVDALEAVLELRLKQRRLSGEAETGLPVLKNIAS
jgi:hypothetical protein